MIQLKLPSEEEIQKYMNPEKDVYLGSQGHYYCARCGEMVGFPIWGQVGYFIWKEDASAVIHGKHFCKGEKKDEVWKKRKEEQRK